MRSSLLWLAVSAGALLPLAATAAQAPAAWDTAPTLLVDPHAAALAQPITADRLCAVVGRRLSVFLRRPLRGQLDVNGLDRLRAWTWSYLARAAVRCAVLTGDMRLVDDVLSGFSGYEQVGHLFEQRDGYGWYTEDTRRSLAYREVPIAGLVVAPVVDLLLASADEELLARRLAPVRARLIDVVAQGLAGLEHTYHEQNGLGFYRQPAVADVWPLNLASVYARPLLGLWQLTGRPEYLREAKGVARTWKAALVRGEGGGVTWPYTPRPGSLEMLRGPGERMWKAAAGIEFPLAAYQAGIGVERADIEAIARAPISTLLVRLDAAHYRVRRLVDPTSSDFQSLDAEHPDHILALASWMSLLCVDERIASKLDPFLLGLDPEYYLGTEHALMSTADRLLHERGRAAGHPERCGVGVAGAPRS